MSVNKINGTFFYDHSKTNNVSDSSTNLKIKSINKSSFENSYGDKYIKYNGNPEDDEVRIKSSLHLKSNSQTSGVSDSFKSIFDDKSKNVFRKSASSNSVEIEDANFVEVNDEGDVIGKGHYYSSGSSSFKSMINKESQNHIFEKYTNQSTLRKGALVNLVV